MTGISADLAKRLRALSESARSSADQAVDDRAARDEAIGEADAAGHGIRQIAEACGMSPSHVQRIVVVETVRRQAAQNED